VGAFVADLSHHPEPFETWLEEETGGPRYDPTLWLVGRDGGRMVAALIARVGSSRADRGWVDYLGVLPGWRGRGIGIALLGRCFAAFQGRGVRRVLLNVDARNPTGATALYERVGMTIAKRWDRWERALQAAP
jgi:ribosomal protein S18 acetylase RimI-like enzyme